MNSLDGKNLATTGAFVSLEGERFYTIRDVDKMAPFFISVISDSDHWLFISSTGGLTAGRVSPETALFPYVTVDKIHESTSHTGSKTLIRVEAKDGYQHWEPFNRAHDGRFKVSRHIYKNILGNKLRFEEINHDLNLAFRYTWVTSDQYGFIRDCELQNLGNQNICMELVDSLQNILPAGTPLFTQTNSSNLVDAYKWAELDERTGLAYFTLYSGITDQAEPSEMLKASTVFCLGLDSPVVLLCSGQLESFSLGGSVQQENHKRGIRAAYMVNAKLVLSPGMSKHWQLVANLEQSQSQAVELRKQLREPPEIARAIAASVDEGSDSLARIVAGGDGFQVTDEESVTAHHCANTVFNILRGGIFSDQYRVSAADFSRTIRMFNQDLYKRHAALFAQLPQQLDFARLQSMIKDQGDAQLERLGLEYLPITFGRRHGDPSRPWNQFAIKLKDKNGERLLSYQGNWRDIFQNWEALTFSYPEYIESVIAKFVNASTMDGYNPYRITKEGIDWEVEEPDDPWGYIGYWGDHQIIYLQKLLELSNQFHPEKLGLLLQQEIFCYANVPYRLKPLSALLEDAKSTVDFDEDLASRIEQRVAKMGADGKLIPDDKGQVYQVNLLEKLLVPLLCKLGNLVIDGGIWLNTQRPEWNDANNALVGQGLSMVTLYYMRRYIRFLQQLLSDQPDSTSLSTEVSQWLTDTAIALAVIRPQLGDKPVSSTLRYQSMMSLGDAASRYRQAVYKQSSFTAKTSQTIGHIMSMLNDALAAVDHTIGTNQRKDGLFHAYNLLVLGTQTVSIDRLYPMLEGQVARLSAGEIEPAKAVSLLESLFESDIYRADQKTFMLYPDRQLPGFLAKNRIPVELVNSIPVLGQMLALGDESIVLRDADGCFRFSAEFTNIRDLNTQLELQTPRYGDELVTAVETIRSLYERVFNHRAFTGRSGGMFGFEGLGCIYWHMVAKLLLAVQENYFWALEQGADKTTCRQLGSLYYRVRDGLGFNKTPVEYGAFPMDPYSHTPKHAGAQQPGMTGQVKEEVLTRFGELGLRVSGGTVRFEPALLRRREFATRATELRYLDVGNNWQTLTVPVAGLAFTWCQTPVVMLLDDTVEPALTLYLSDGTEQVLINPVLSQETSAELFNRSGQIRQLKLVVHTNQLFGE